MPTRAVFSPSASGEIHAHNLRINRRLQQASLPRSYHRQDLTQCFHEHYALPQAGLSSYSFFSMPRFLTLAVDRPLSSSVDIELELSGCRVADAGGRGPLVLPRAQSRSCSSGAPFTRLPVHHLKVLRVSSDDGNGPVAPLRRLFDVAHGRGRVDRQCRIAQAQRQADRSRFQTGPRTRGATVDCGTTVPGLSDRRSAPSTSR